jgi:hypothetical protein
MAVFANQPMVSTHGNAVNICFEKNGKIVSIALDDSCGRMTKLRRGDIELQRRVNEGPVQVCTSEVFRNSETQTIHASLENVELALHWLNRVRWGLNS